MNLHFHKYQGAGNDFILIDARDGLPNPLDKLQVARLCDRRFGVGGDGLMLLKSHENYDFEMAYYNADGNPGSMCGNGGRCIVAFARHLGVIDKETNFLAVDGPHYARITDEGNWVDLQMINVNTIHTDGEAFVLNTGSPHYVLEKPDLQHVDVYKEGKAIRNSQTYTEKGINVNFVELSGDHLFVRTYERGVEDETYACGTGVTAVALSMAYKAGLNGHVETDVQVLGGKLRITFDYDGDTFTNIFLCGPAEKVFEGKVAI